MSLFGELLTLGKKGFDGLFDLSALNERSVDELVELGYPELVAKKISDGTLPMDEPSRQARADAMGMGPDMYRGHADGNYPRSNQDIWMTDDPDVAQTYAMGGEYYDEALDRYAIKEGQVTPLRHNANNLLEMDAEGQHFEDIYAERADFPYFTDEQWDGALSSGTDGIASSVKDEGVRQGSRFTNILDDFDADGAFEPSTVENVLGTRPDVKIRSTMAAFDPEYGGSNILGFADPKLLAGTAAGTAGLLGLVAPEEAEGAPLKMLVQGGGDAAGMLYKALMRAQGAGLTPGSAMKQIMHNDSMTTYNKMVREALKRDGMKAGPWYKQQIKDMILPIAKDPRFAKSKFAQDALREWALPRMARGKEFREQRGEAVLDALLPVAGVGLATAALSAPHIKDSGMISSPRSESLFDVTMGMRDLERRLDGSVASLLSMTGLSDYLETVNRREEDPTWGTRAGAALDFL